MRPWTKKYGISLDELISLNGLDKEDYIYGLKKLIPRASEEELEKKAKEQLELLDKIS